MKKEVKLNLATFDFAKGVAVLGILLGHMFSHYDASQTPGLIPVSALLFLLQNAINPMFFIASGFGFRAKPPKKMLAKTKKELLKPYLYVTLFIALLFPLIHFGFYRWWPGAFQEMLRYLLAFLLGIPKTGKTVLGFYLYECSVMWFFLALFLAMNLLNRILSREPGPAPLLCVAACALLGFVLTLVFALNLLYQLLSRGLSPILIICVLACVLCGFIVALNLLKVLFRKPAFAPLICVVTCVLAGYTLTLVDFDFFCLPQGLMSVGYCYLGYLLRQWGLLTDGKPRPRLCIALTLVTLAQLFLGSFNLAHGVLGYGLLDYAASCCAGTLLLFLCVFIGQKEWKCLDWVKQVGVYSYWIMCIHSVELVCIPWYILPQILSGHQFAAFLIEIALKCAIIAAGCFAFKKISRQMYKRRIKSIGK